MTARILQTLLTLLPLASGCASMGGYLGARAMDLADCVKVNVGIGIGATLDVHVTDYVSPGLGIVSYTMNFGYEDRVVNGVWLENLVINTPRFAYETVARTLEEAGPDENLDGAVLISQLALRSMLLPNERWIRDSSGELTVRYYNLLNIAGLGEQNRATALTGLLRRAGERPRSVDNDVWQASFLEVGATAGVVEARLGFNPLQLVDFFAGLFGLDPADDDPPIQIIVPRTPPAADRS